MVEVSAAIEDADRGHASPYKVERISVGRLAYPAIF
jgi:hypothetical protein